MYSYIFIVYCIIFIGTSNLRSMDPGFSGGRGLVEGKASLSPLSRARRSGPWPVSAARVFF